MSHITTHVLDTSRGRPAAGVGVSLFRQREPENWHLVAKGATDPDGRLKLAFFDGTALEEGVYRLRFRTGAYFEAQGVEGFYPLVEIVFAVRDAAQHYHVPLLVSPFGYSTYRGS
jgi:5-hydroxyisourate hydrolase